MLAEIAILLVSFKPSLVSVPYVFAIRITSLRDLLRAVQYGSWIVSLAIPILVLRRCFVVPTMSNIALFVEARESNPLHQYQ